MSKTNRNVGLVECIVIFVVLVLLWQFTDFKDWLLERGGIIKVMKGMFQQ